MAGIIHILRQDDTASSPGFFPSASPSFLLARVAKRGKKFIRKVFTASFLPPFARLGGGGRERGRLEEVDLIGPASSEFLIRDISFRASFRCNERET